MHIKARIDELSEQEAKAALEGMCRYEGILAYTVAFKRIGTVDDYINLELDKALKEAARE